jgi:hypothetical protein
MRSLLPLSKTFGEPVRVVWGIPSPDKRESKEKLIMKARKYENTKKRESKFRIFVVKKLFHKMPGINYLVLIYFLQ